MLAAIALIFTATANGQVCIEPVPSGFPVADTSWHSGWSEAPTPSAARARLGLGQRLFSDPRLSRTGRHSCASCHQVGAHLSDGRSLGLGALGDNLRSNTPTLFNSGLKGQLEWRSGGPEKLFEQHLGPLENDSPVELGTGAAQLAALNADPRLGELLARSALPDDQGSGVPRFTADIVARLIALHVSTLRCATTFDRYLLEGDSDALTPAARRGLALFSSARLGCAGCHNGPLLGGGLRSRSQQFPAGTQTRNREKETIELTIPSLRGVAHTAPYYFDGSAPSLSAVLDDYERGRFSELPRFSLTAAEREALLTFLESL